MAITQRNPYPSPEARAFLEAIGETEEPSYLTIEELTPGALYYGHGGKVEPVAIFRGLGEAGVSFEGLLISNGRAKPVVETRSQYSSHGSTFRPKRLLSLDKYPGRSGLDWMISEYLAYLGSRIDTIEQDAHKFKGTLLYESELSYTKARIKFMQPIQAY